MEEQEPFDFEKFWLSGPWEKLGKKSAASKFKKSVKTRDDWNQIQGARDQYAAYLALNKWLHPQHGKTWFNNWQDWLSEEIAQDTEPAELKTHLCQCCEPEHEWACENSAECTSSLELACPTFRQGLQRRLAVAR